MRHNASGRVAGLLATKLSRVLSHALMARRVRLVECGFLTSEPGAHAQSFHTDTAPHTLGSCEAAAVKVAEAMPPVGPETMFEDVYMNPTQQLKDQKKYLHELVQKGGIGAEVGHFPL